MKQDLLKGLTEAQIARVKGCKNQEELLTLAKEEGIELTEEQLEGINGGCGSGSDKPKQCPKCGGTKITTKTYLGQGGTEREYIYRCSTCGHEWRR